MANLKASLKDIRKTESRRVYNRQWTNTMKFMVKKLRNTKNKEEAKKLLPALISRVDKLSKKNIIHRNKAGRIASRLTKFVNSLS
ncbi:MAG: 30S ribosomal protein S20 [Bacteroidetes bacterium]|nr:30S ribosomal protein S20 [Bacteroidota bacterium]